MTSSNFYSPVLFYECEILLKLKRFSEKIQMYSTKYWCVYKYIYIKENVLGLPDGMHVFISITHTYIYMYVYECVNEWNNYVCMYRI